MLTAAQITAFFENDDQMGIPHATVVQLEDQGLLSPDDLTEFDTEAFKEIAANLRRPTGRIPDPNPGAAEGATIPQPPFVFGAKSQQRLKAAAELTRYYETINRPITPASMRWNYVVSNFKDAWEILVKRSKERYDYRSSPGIRRSTRSTLPNTNAYNFTTPIIIRLTRNLATYVK